MCHPDERWDEKHGCVPTAAAKAIRCGSERDARTSCSCRPDDLDCMMHCAANRPRRRTINWDQPAPPWSTRIAKAVRRGHAPSCLRLGTTFVRGQNAAQTRGMDLIEQSCKLGYGPGCYELFHLYRWLPESRSRPYAAQLARSSVQPEAG